MCVGWKLVGKVAVFMTGCWIGVWVLPALAQEESSVVVEGRAAPADEQPVLPPPTGDAISETIPAPNATDAVVHPAPPTVYRASRSARRMFRCQEQVELIMVTKNPADCCLYEICLRVPACCVGEPAVAERRGFLGRGVVEYCWECGFSATVKFRHRRGDVKVEYDG